MKNINRIVLAGSGGQGLGQGGRILAEAALRDGKNATQSQSYGARARGGYSSSTVIISDGEILYPLTENPNILIVLTQEAYDVNRPLLTPGGLLIYDRESIKVNIRDESSGHGFPMKQKVRELKNEKGIALLALGILTEMTDLVKPVNVEEVIKKNFAPEYTGSNILAFREGLIMGGNYKK